MKYHVVAARSELDSSPQMHVSIDDHEILLCRDGEDFYAVSYYCSHDHFTLEGGMVTNGCITCPYHGAEFSLRTGEVLAPPAFEPVCTFPVRVADDVISIGLPD